jgi:predicted RNase H-like HicB family nuclease
MRYAVVIEKTTGNYSAYVPDLSGCVATGASIPEVENAIQEAIAFRLAGLKEDGIRPPTPLTKVEYVDVAG